MGKIGEVRRARNGHDVRVSGGYGRLDRTAILDAALRIAERPGTSEIRFRDLGDELGADPTAVYRHFRDKQHLIAAAIDRLMHDIGTRVPAGAPWRTTLYAVAAELFETFTRHPAIGRHLADVRPVGPSELALVERVLRALEEAGLRDDPLVRRYAALSAFSTAYLAGACRELIAAGSTSAAGADAIPWLPDADITEDTHPVFARYAVQIGALDFRSTYDAAIAVLVEAIADTVTPIGGP
jgi:AcrR family transcriptional regulator